MGKRLSHTEGSPSLLGWLIRGHVIDFLDFQFGSYHWPAFNVADSCICVAAGLFLLSGFMTPDKPAAS